MIENINLCGIDNKTIEIMFDTLEYNDILSLASNYELVKLNIEYLKNIGIKCINDLLINRHYIFLIDNDILRKSLSKHSYSTVSELVNNDYTELDNLIGGIK